MKKAKACFADGGQISKADQMIAEMERKYGVSGNSQPAPPPVQQPAPQPVQPQQPRGLIGDAINIFSNRQKQIDKAAGYANGGLIGNAAQYWQDDNAKFEQASPNIGQRILRGINPITGFGSAMGAMKSAAEQGSIPGMGMALIQAIPAAGMIRAVPAVGAVKASVVPSVTRTAVATGGGATANAIADDVQQRTAYRNGGKIKGSGTPTSDSIDAQVNETGEPIKVSTTERILSAAQDAMLEDMARKSGFESLDAMLEAGTGKPVGPTINGGKRAAENGGIFDRDPLAALSVAIGKNNAAVDAANSSVQKLYPEGTFDNSSKRTPVTAASAQPTTSGNPLVAGISNPSFGQAKDRFPIDAKSEFITGTNGAMPDSSGGGFVDGNTAYTVKPTSQDGISRVTAPGKNPLYTNISPESAVAGLNKQTIGQPADQEAQGVARIANANSIRGEMIANRDKGIPAGGYAPSILADRSVEDNAALDAMRRSSMISNLSPSQQAEFNMNLARMAQQERGQNLAADTARHTADAQEKRAAGHDQTLATIEANKLAGNPLEQQAKQLELKQKGIIAGLFEKANAGDKEALAKYNALTSGGKEPNYSNRYITLPNRKTYNDMGQVTGEEPGGVFDAQTGQPVNFGKHPAASAPAGYKLVGTSGGRPVYEDAKGNRFVDGGK